jgi:hypothetical protein
MARDRCPEESWRFSRSCLGYFLVFKVEVVEVSGSLLIGLLIIFVLKGKV